MNVLSGQFTRAVNPVDHNVELISKILRKQAERLSVSNQKVPDM